jgi:hypothetical protein
MKKLFFIPVFCLLFFTQGFATHNRAGEITYQVLDCATRTYRITITTYTKLCPVCPDRDYLDSVHWGDNSMSQVPRASFSDTLGDSIRVNKYIMNHTYSGNGIYTIYFVDPNRNEGIQNIPNSVNVPFCVKTTIGIYPVAFGCNSTPVLTKPPIDKGCVGEIFRHNPFAIDPDGDSLSYQLAVPLATINQPNNINVPVQGYSLPAASNPPVTLNAITGDLVWDSPLAAGEYNIAFFIIEWRYGYPFDTVMRDMQITIIAPCTNNRPQFAQLNDTCILAGQTITFNVTATDQNPNSIELTTAGAPYLVAQPASFSSNSPANPVTGTFNWNTACSHIRPQPYTVFFAAEDNGIPQLVDLTSVNIRIVAPPPQNLTATASGNAIVLNWSPGACPTDSGYYIYRRAGPYNGVFNCPCETGVPAGSGYTRIATVIGNNNTTYTDSLNNLIIGVEYCYVVTAFFRNGAESCPSNEACARLKKELPVITHASVMTTNITTGSVYVDWSKPDELDTIQYPPPYEYRLYHSHGFFGNNFVPIPIVIYNDINDTTFVDTSINTQDSAWSYKVEFYYGTAVTLKGSTEIASTVFLSIAPTDEQLNLSWQEHVPWTNHYFDVFRAAMPAPQCFDTTGLAWDSIGRAFTHNFFDTNLTNGVTYRYYVKSSGTYSAPGYDTLRNNSQEKCAAPYDNVPPCPPAIAVTPDCIAQSNLLTWNNPNNSCADDVIMYHIYYRPALNNDFQLIQTINNPADTSFIHSGLQSIAGCYYITAIDSNLNESSPSVFACVDTCFVYNIPNVFSPDGSGLNDLLHPCDFSTTAEMQIKCPPYQNVKDVDIKFFNRWGEIVFETTDRDIKWNGKNKDTGKDCPDGVYYYTGIVNFIRIYGISTREVNGFVHILRKRK